MRNQQPIEHVCPSWWCGMALCCVLLIGCAIGAFAAQPAGMITGMKGEVKWKASADAKLLPAQLMMTMLPGSMIMVGKKASAILVFFANGNRVQLAENTTVKLTESACQVTSGSCKPLPPASGKAGTVMLKARMESINGGLLTRVGPYRPRLMLLTPIADDSLLTVTPCFCWTEEPNAQLYQVRLTDTAGARLWLQTTTNSLLPYPEKTPALTPGTKYICAVRAMQGDTVLSEKSVAFTILPQDKYTGIRDALNPGAEVDATVPPTNVDDCTQLLWRASLCQTEKLYGDAIQYYQLVATLYPNDPGIYDTLSRLYSLQGYHHSDLAEYEKWKMDMASKGER